MHPGYGACSPPHPGPLLFAPAYGVQMAVSPPTRTHIDPYAASADLNDGQRQWGQWYLAAHLRARRR